MPSWAALALRRTKFRSDRRTVMVLFLAVVFWAIACSRLFSAAVTGRAESQSIASCMAVSSLVSLNIGLVVFIVIF